jgi:hypothetical protein
VARIVAEPHVLEVNSIMLIKPTYPCSTYFFQALYIFLIFYFLISMKYNKFAEWLINCQFVLEILSPKLNHFDRTYLKI